MTYLAFSPDVMEEYAENTCPLLREADDPADLSAFATHTIFVGEPDGE